VHRQPTWRERTMVPWLPPPPPPLSAASVRPSHPGSHGVLWGLTVSSGDLTVSSGGLTVSSGVSRCPLGVSRCPLEVSRCPLGVSRCPWFLQTVLSSWAVPHSSSSSFSHLVSWGNCREDALAALTEVSAGRTERSSEVGGGAAGL